LLGGVIGELPDASIAVSRQYSVVAGVAIIVIAPQTPKENNIEPKPLFGVFLFLLLIFSLVLMF